MSTFKEDAERVAKERAVYDNEKKVKVTALIDNLNDDGVIVRVWGFDFSCKTEIDDDGKAECTYTGEMPESAAKAFKKLKRVK